MRTAPQPETDLTFLAHELPATDCPCGLTDRSDRGGRTPLIDLEVPAAVAGRARSTSGRIQALERGLLVAGNAHGHGAPAETEGC